MFLSFAALVAHHLWAILKICEGQQYVQHICCWRHQVEIKNIIPPTTQTCSHSANQHTQPSRSIQLIHPLSQVHSPTPANPPTHPSSYPATSHPATQLPSQPSTHPPVHAMPQSLCSRDMGTNAVATSRRKGMLVDVLLSLLLSMRCKTNSPGLWPSGRCKFTLNHAEDSI